MFPRSRSWLLFNLFGEGWRLPDVFLRRPTWRNAGECCEPKHFAAWLTTEEVRLLPRSKPSSPGAAWEESTGAGTAASAEVHDDQAARGPGRVTCRVQFAQWFRRPACCSAVVEEASEREVL